MTTTKDKIQQFMESPLVAWAKTFDDTNTVDSVEDLADGILLNKIMNTVNASNYNMSKVNRSVSNDPAARVQNLQLLVTRIKHFYLTDLQQLIITPLPKIGDICNNPRDDMSLDEMEKLLVLLLGCVVQCEGRGPLIERMTTMDFIQQQALVVYIKEMTDTTNYVCSIDWNDLGEISRNNLEGLCRTAYLHLQRVAKERDGHFDVLLDTIVERDYYKQVFDTTDGGNESLPRENGLALPSTPVRSPSVNTELMDLKKKSRLTQEQLDHKSLQLSETKEELERVLTAIQKLQQEKQEMATEAKAARMYRDEIETLKVQSARVDRLEVDVKKYRQKAEDAEYLRKRISDLKQQNELMLETKSLLEQKATSLTARADMVDELQTELASLRAQVESLAQEKEMSGEREEELMSRVTHMELDNKNCQEQIEELTTMLEAEREKSDIGSTGDASNLSFEMTEADLASKAKVLRLEKESRELEKTTESLRQSQAKSVELEKTNKKLYSQTHADRKEIIKLREEVEVLRVKASRVDKLQVELNSLREKLEDSSRSQAKLKEFKTRSEAALQAKARLEDEVESLMTKLQQFNHIKDESASLKAQIESFTSKHSDDEKRIQELLEQNAQLLLDKQRSGEELTVLQGQLEAERSRSSGSQTTVTLVSPPRLSETEMASRAKVQRLEKERREMEKTIEGFRKSQAKLAELEKTNKKLQEQTHSDRREVIRLREELQVFKSKAERLNSLQSAMKTQEHKLEDVDAAMKKITELKQQNALLSETKVLLQDEVSELHSRLEKLNDVQAENSALKVRVESQETELKEEGQRMQTLLQQNVQLELDRDRKVGELESMQIEVERLKRNLPVPDEVPFSPAGRLFSEQDIALQTKVLHLEKDKRDLEQSLQLLKRSQEKVEAETQSSKQKLTEQLHNYRKEVAKLKEELQREKAQVELLQLPRSKSTDSTEQDQKQAKQMHELEGKFNEAYSQSLSMKDERIGVLERRIEELISDNEQLKSETSLLKRQNERMQRKNSASGSSPNTSFSRSHSPREIHRLREEAAEARDLRQGVRHLQQENHGLKADMDEARIYIERSEAANQRMQSRVQMLEQLNSTLDEEKRIMREQLDRLMSQNQDLFVKNLDSKDQALMDERIFNDRLGELEKDKARLSEQLIAQQREHLVREMDILKKSKSKNLLKKGFKKLKGKIQGRSHVFEHDVDGSGSPSHVSMGLPPYALHDGSMSSSQSISSSNSGRDPDNQEEGEIPHDGASTGSGAGSGVVATGTGTAAGGGGGGAGGTGSQSGLIPRGPTSVETPPYMRKKRANTMPNAAVKLRHPPTSSPQIMPEISEDLMSLEDFLAESDRTPNRRRVMELKRASLIINSPPMTPRNSLLLSGPHSAGLSGHPSSSSMSGEKMFDLMEFLSNPGNIRQSITEVDEGRELLHQQAAEFHSQGSGLSSSQGLSQGWSQLSQHSDGKSSNVELNTSLNSNGNNNNNNNNNNNVSVYDTRSVGDLTEMQDGRDNNRPPSEICFSVEEVLSELDVSVASTLSQSGTWSQMDYDTRPHPQAPPTNESATSTTSTHAAEVTQSSSTFSQPPPSSYLSLSELTATQTHSSSSSHLAVSQDRALTSRDLSVQHQRQHSRSFNSGLNTISVPLRQQHHPPRSQTFSLSKSVSTDRLHQKAATTTRRKGKSKQKDAREVVGSKKKRHARSTETLATKAGPRKPPLGRPKRRKLVLRPRGPLFGTDGGAPELRRHSALMLEETSQLSQLTQLDQPDTEEESQVAARDRVREEESENVSRERSVSLQATVTAAPLAVAEDDSNSVSLLDFLESQLSAQETEEYGQF